MSGVGVSSGSPHWSVVRPLIAVPLLMARLPGNNAIVWVGPPLLARVQAEGPRDSSGRYCRWIH